VLNFRDKELYDSSNLIKLDKLAKCDSLTSPSNEFLFKMRYSNIDSKPILLGIFPLNWLLESNKVCNVLMFPKDVGISPCSSLLERLRYARKFIMLPKLSGM